MLINRLSADPILPLVVRRELKHRPAFAVESPRSG